MTLKSSIRRLLRHYDYDVYRPSGLPMNLAATIADSRKRRLLTDARVDVVLDVGANEGQYATMLRGRWGFNGRIVSFEPLSAAYATLQQAALADPLWTTFHLALGETAAVRQINVAGNSQSSSLLPMCAQHVDSAPESAYVGTEEIRIASLDSLAPRLDLASHRVYMKIDTQGFERNVLEGAKETLSGIDTLELEVSFVPLYDGQSLFADLHDYLLRLGYVMSDIEPGFRDPDSGQILQADIVFRKVVS